MADSGSNVEKPNEQQMLLNNNYDSHEQQSPSYHSNLVTKRSKSRSKPAALKNAKKVTISATVVSPSLCCSCTIILEEGKDLPVFWNGENPVPLIKWTPSQENERNKHQFFSSIHDFLSTYAAGKYLRKCSMSLQASSTKYINNLKMSDPFSKIFDHYNKDGMPVTLLLTHNANGEDGESGYSKFTLSIREVNGKKVLWNGSIPTNRVVAKLKQSDMSVTIENCLLNYVAKGYLIQNCQVDLVKDCSDSIRSKREELNTISMEDLVSTLFKGNSASIVIRSNASSGACGNENDVLQFADLTDMSASSSTKIPVFTSPPVECHWIGMTWGAIKEEVSELVNSVEITMRDTILPTDIYGSVLDKKRSLETAIRRRCRIVDEVWRSYLVLRAAHNDLLSGNMRLGNSSSPRTGDTGGDVDNALQIHRSCIDFLSSSLIRYGLELELYDEETQGLTRIAGVGVGIAVVVAICTVVYYF